MFEFFAATRFLYRRFKWFMLCGGKKYLQALYSSISLWPRHCFVSFRETASRAPSLAKQSFSPFQLSIV